jgi:hypothetical protein
MTAMAVRKWSRKKKRKRKKIPEPISRQGKSS